MFGRLNMRKGFIHPKNENENEKRVLWKGTYLKREGRKWIWQKGLFKRISRNDCINWKHKHKHVTSATTKQQQEPIICLSKLGAKNSSCSLEKKKKLKIKLQIVPMCEVIDKLSVVVNCIVKDDYAYPWSLSLKILFL